MRFIIGFLRSNVNINTLVSVENIIYYEVIKEFDDLSLFTFNRHMDGYVSKLLNKSFIYGDLSICMNSSDISRIEENGYTIIYKTSSGFITIIDTWKLTDFKSFIRNEKIQSIFT
jgi:hypothetical protein